MKIRYHKPVSVYTHPAITEYEFNRMKKVEKAYLIICSASFMVMMFSFPCILISSAKESRNNLPAITEAKPKPLPKPIAEAVGEVNLDTTFAINVDVGSTTIDTR